jgi:hypothetical protein
LRQPDRGPVGRTKRATLKEHLLKRRELDNSSEPIRRREKDSPPEKNIIDKKELLTHDE